MELFTVRLSKPQQMPQKTKLCTLGDAEFVGQSITEFNYDTDVKSTFPKWFARYEDLIVDLKEQADDWKVRLLLRKLGLTAYNLYSNYILPKHLQVYNFTETLEILKQIFGECTSLFNIHF